MIDEIKFKTRQFEDDMILTLLFEIETIETVVGILGKYQSISGLKLNFDKSSVHRIGAFKNTNRKIEVSQPLRWTNEGISILGIHIRENEQEMLDLNYEYIIDKIVNIINELEKQRSYCFGENNNA